MKVLELLAFSFGLFPLVCVYAKFPKRYDDSFLSKGEKLSNSLNLILDYM